MRLSACLLALCLAGAPSLAREISGTAAYQARIALPPASTLSVTVSGWRQTPVASARIATEGRQVPLSFRVGVPDDLTLTLQLGLGDDTGLRWVSDPITLPAGRDALDIGEVFLAPYRPLAFATRLVCGGTELTIGQDGDTTILETPVRRYVLRSVPTASGAGYVATDDPETTIRTKGDQATVTLAGTPLPECATRPAGSPGPFRAQGQEPGWGLDMTHDGARLTWQDGRTQDLPPAQAELQDGIYRVTWTEAGLALEVAERLCRDSMTGMPYPYAAILTNGDGSMPGCGGDPAELLRGADWIADRIGNTTVVSDRPPSLAVANGRVSGTTGCNRYFGSFELTGEGVTIGPAGATMMACPAELMTQERGYLDALSRVARFDLTEDGALLFFAADDPEPILRFRRQRP